MRHVAWLVVLIAFGTAGIDYAFKASAAASLSSSEELVSFFSKFYLATGIAALFLQTTFASWFVKKAGIAAAVGTLPITLVLLAPLALIEPSLLVLAFYRGGASIIESSSYRSGYELLYTPLAPETKRPAKALIDVGADKLGAALGGAFAVFLVGLAPDSTVFVLVTTAIICGIAALRMALQRSSEAHIGPLVDALRDPGLPIETRIAVAGILGHARTRRCASELISALDSESLAIRVAIAHALAVSESFAEPKFGERILSAIESELLELHLLHTVVEMRELTGDSADTAVVAQHLACCLLLLSTMAHAHAIENAIVALGDGSDLERGTGREYIDNIVPESIRYLLRSETGNRHVAAAASRIYHSEERPGPPSVNNDRSNGPAFPIAALLISSFGPHLTANYSVCCP
ncbi:MAG: hypothetical protein GY811_24405 [Myxococcales bacterium]|nr:hypothetical protein [Myxococcales bacterium]